MSERQQKGPTYDAVNRSSTMPLHAEMWVQEVKASFKGELEMQMSSR